MYARYFIDQQEKIQFEVRRKIEKNRIILLARGLRKILYKKKNSNSKCEGKSEKKIELFYQQGDREKFFAKNKNSNLR